MRVTHITFKKILGRSKINHLQNENYATVSFYFEHVLFYNSLTAKLNRFVLNYVLLKSSLFTSPLKNLSGSGRFGKVALAPRGDAYDFT